VLLILGAALTAVTVAADTTSVSLAFSGCGAAEYNRWLSQNGEEYPGLEPVRVQVDSEVAGDSNRYSYYVSFLDDTGSVVRQRTFTGVRESRAADGRWNWMRARRSDQGDVLFVCPEVGLTTVYGQSGDSAFTSTEGVIDGAAGLYFREFVDGDGTVYRNLIEVLDAHGRSSDTLGELLEPRIQAHAWSRDSVHALYASDSAGRVVVLNKSGEELWQYRLQSETDAHVAIAEDARFVAVATWDSLVVRNLRTGNTFACPLQEGGRGKFVRPKVAISRDSRYVAVTRFHASAHDSVLLDVFTSAGAAVCTSRALRTGMVMDAGFADDKVCLVTRALESPGTGVTRVLNAWLRRPSWKEPYRIVLVGLDGRMRTWDGIGPAHPHPPFKLAGNALAFYGEESISVYRIAASRTENRRQDGTLP